MSERERERGEREALYRVSPPLRSPSEIVREREREKDRETERETERRKARPHSQLFAEAFLLCQKNTTSPIPLSNPVWKWKWKSKRHHM